MTTDDPLRELEKKAKRLGDLCGEAEEEDLIDSTAKRWD
jgi:hypothetical protein